MRSPTDMISIGEESWSELTNIANGTFQPLQGFLTEYEYRSVVDDMCLPDGTTWPLPITLELDEKVADRVCLGRVLPLVVQSGKVVGELEVSDVFCVDREEDIRKVFGVTDRAHPGVLKESLRSRFRVGGQCRVTTPWCPPDSDQAYLTPTQTRTHFQERGWKKVVGFQTRNPPHLAHEYLHRIGLEIADAIFLQPLVGWKKQGDFLPPAVMGAYRILTDQFYPKDRTLLGSLRTPMRYAGPREAVFHAIIRRNHGCTHFIVGRDHAGVGRFYGKYEAQSLAKSIANLGITILALAGPYFCSKCGQVVTERSCQHGEQFVQHVSGERLRELLRVGEPIPKEFMRPEISKFLGELGALAIY